MESFDTPKEEERKGRAYEELSDEEQLEIDMENRFRGDREWPLVDGAWCFVLGYNDHTEAF